MLNGRNHISIYSYLLISHSINLNLVFTPIHEILIISLCQDNTVINNNDIQTLKLVCLLMYDTLI